MVSKLSEEGRWLIAIENITAMVSISLWSTRAGNKLIVGRIINRSKLFILFLFSGLILDPDARRVPRAPRRGMVIMDSMRGGELATCGCVGM
jgi:hypothetical protein